MKWRSIYMFFLITVMKSSQISYVDSDTALSNKNTSTADRLSKISLIKDAKVPIFSPWSHWSSCHKGQKTRRRHCVIRHVCRGSLRIEVASCVSSSPLKIQRKRNHIGRLRIQTKHLRQLEVEDIQKRFRGFSPWGAWSSCSRKCTTVRRRYCQRPELCSRKTVRQSAYCYLEGSFCHQWIRRRMQRRKDPGYTVVEDMPPPSPAIHPEDSYASIAPPPCGILGHVYGSPADRMRSRMQDMIRIIGGRPSPPGKWPWQVAVLNRYKEAFCGGTLVHLRWVITAAHCIRKRLYIRLGEHDLLVKNYGEVEMRVSRAVVHPLYDPDTVVNDVALLRLPSTARPDLGHGLACLPEPDLTLPPHSACVILGWGKKRSTDVHGTRILHEAQVSTIQQGVCRRSYWQYAITDNMVCAGRGRRDSCAGDSGGPLLCKGRDMRYYLQGITSFGDGCGKRGKFGIYTRTAGYVTWIQDIMNRDYFDD